MVCAAPSIVRSVAAGAELSEHATATVTAMATLVAASVARRRMDWIDIMEVTPVRTWSGELPTLG
jgi:hypothetical protein